MAVSKTSVVLTYKRHSSVTMRILMLFSSCIKKSGSLDLRFSKQAMPTAEAKAKTVNRDTSVVRDEAGLEEQRLGTVHLKILLNSDLGQSLRDLPSTAV